MDLGLLYKALEQGQVSMVAGNATDGQLSVLDAVILQDDKHYFPPYDCGLVVRRQSLERPILPCGKPSPNWPDGLPIRPCAS